MSSQLSKYLFKFRGIRKKLIFHIKNYFYRELEISVPVENGYYADLLESDAYDSFSEIFVQKEYESFLPELPLNKIIDIGSNYGFFTLWLQSIQPEVDLYSIMIEPSDRCSHTLKKFVSNQHFRNRFKYIQKAIGDPNEEKVTFYDRPFMSGSTFSDNQYSIKNSVNTLKIEDFKLSSYDLIKCDIEGSEWEFLVNYSEIILKTSYILIEWHSWHKGGGGYSQIKQKIQDLEFDIIKSSSFKPAVGRSGEVGLLLAKNLR